MTISPGAAVRLVSRPDTIGVVMSTRVVHGEVKADVFHDNEVNEYFVEQLMPVGGPARKLDVSAEDLRVGLTAELLRDPNTVYLHARGAGRIDYEPYQYRPVLKIVQADRPRILVADDVGVGKTIEACLILKELQARERAETVLIICPKPLVVDDKWRNELKRFDEDFVHLDSRTLRYCLNEYDKENVWPARYAKAILPYSLLDKRLLLGARNAIGLVGLTPGPIFDLVIVDEAHHVRNRTTDAYKCVQRLSESANSLVLLSATPLQTSSQDLFTLLNLLRDDLIPSERDFANMLEPNSHLHLAVEFARAGGEGWTGAVSGALDGALATTWGRAVMTVDPAVSEVRKLITNSDNPDETTRVRVIRLLQELNTFSQIITRTRRRDIASFTTRKPSAPVVDFTPAQKVVYDEVLELGREIAQLQSPGVPIDFLLALLRRQAASSISGLGDLVKDLLQNRLDRVEFGEVTDAPEIEPELFPDLRLRIEAIGRAAAELDRLPDPKIVALRQIIDDKQLDSNNKVLVFSTFRHTLGYLARKAENWGIRVGLVHGDIPDEERHQLRRRFKLPVDHSDAIDMFLCSEVGTEGLDFQFCNTIVNYDIPWNPMRIEQRIGRIDRRGQLSESVAIVNILTEGTIEAAIYGRCLARIGVFERALGGTEAILGELTAELRRIADDLTLNPDERDARLRKLGENEIARMQEIEHLEEQGHELFGLVTESFDERMAEASSTWLGEDRIGDLVTAFFASLAPERKIGLAKGRTATVRLDTKLVNNLLDSLTKTSGGKVSRFERALKRLPASIRVTTSAETATDDTGIELLSATHPLVRAAAEKFRLGRESVCKLAVTSDLVPPGRHVLSIHTWTRLGTRDMQTIRYISPNAEVEHHADGLISAADNAGDVESLTADETDTLDRLHNREWKRAREVHINEARATAEVRSASLRAQRDRQVDAISAQARTANEPRIQKMRDSELASTRHKFDRFIEQCEVAANRADLVTKHLATVVVEVAAT